MGYDIKIVNLEKSLFRGGKTELPVLRIIPLRFKEGKFVVNVIEYAVTCNKNNINLVNIRGKEFQFKYDCSTNTLDLLEHKLK